MTNETIVPVPHRRKLRLKGMVKLSIVLTPQFLSHDQDQLTKELQQHVKSGTCPCEYLRKAGVQWWCDLSSLQPVPPEFKRFSASASRGTWITGARCHAQVSFLKTVLKSRNVHDRSTDVQRRAWRSNSRGQEGNKIGMEDLYTSLRYMEAKVLAEVHKVTTKVKSLQNKWTEEDSQGRVRMAAVEHHHSSGLPYWPYLTAETLRKRMGRQAPLPTQCHLGGQPPPPAKGCLRPLNLSRLQCRVGPQPHSRTDDFLRREKPQVECALGPVPFPPTGDFVSLKTPPEGPLVPLQPSPVDDFVTPETPPIECLRGPVPSPRGDDFRKRKKPPDSFRTSSTFSPVNDSLSLKTPLECLLVALPHSPVDDFLTPETPTIKSRRGPVPSPQGDDFRRRRTPPDSFFVCLPPSPVDDSLSIKTPPECLVANLPPSPVDYFVTPETTPFECRQGPVPSPQGDDFRRLKKPPDSFFLPSTVDDFRTPETPTVRRRRGPVPSPRGDDFRRCKKPPDFFRTSSTSSS
ncbi:nuclear pore complex-interacting protein family member B3-like isoform X2 [Symphalangus syndactylus]|uniref:nuclear pore complex-interacting protein family member B3-like isoform X2 n=1 Tax=Symphalangus syndactylus TaxID=9590 RepID=UPI003004A2D2